MDEYSYGDYICSECGKHFSVQLTGTYQYKIVCPTKTYYQCGYTCYDHALLRSDNPKNYYPVDRYKRLVLRCESAMLGQGKKILCPIKL